MIDTRITMILMSLSKLEGDFHPAAGNDALMCAQPTDAGSPALAKVLLPTSSVILSRVVHQGEPDALAASL